MKETRPPQPERQKFAADLDGIMRELATLRESNPHGEPELGRALAIAQSHLRSVEENLREFDLVAARRRS